MERAVSWDKFVEKLHKIAVERVLKRGKDAWNRWRRPDLTAVRLVGADLSWADLNRSNLNRSNLSWADLSEACVG